MTVSADARAAAGFLASFGRDPRGVWSAPGRVNVIGEHTDYNGGLALPIAGPWRTCVAVAPRGDGVLRAGTESFPGAPVTVALDEVGPGRPKGWVGYVAGVFWALRKGGYDVPGADIHVATDVPLGAGLASSAALECAVGAAVSDLAGLGLLDDDSGRSTLAGLCRLAENAVVGAPTGGMDQLAALLGRAGQALLVDSGRERTEHVPFDPDSAALALLVVDTGAPHALVDGQYAQRRRECDKAARVLGVPSLREVTTASLPSALTVLPDEVLRARVRHVVTETERVVQCVDALDGRDFPRVGELLLASHVSLRDDFEVSSARLDATVRAAVDSGALGARLTGGGFGGCAIALVPLTQAATVTGAVERAFASAGWAPPHMRRAQACPGAGRAR